MPADAGDAAARECAMTAALAPTRKPRRANADGSVFFWKGRGWYAAVTGPDGRRIQRKAPKQTAAGAEALLRRLLRQRDAGELTRGQVTLAQFKEEWLRAVKLRGCRPRTLDSYREKIEAHVEPTLGRVRLDKLTAGQLEKLYARKLEAGLSLASVRMIHGNLHNLLKLDKRRRLVGQVVTELVDPPKVPKCAARTLSIAELGTLFRAIAGHRRGPFWRFIAETGAGFGEAAGLRRSDVDLEARIARIRTSKTEASLRDCHLTRRAVAALEAQARLVDELRLVAGDGWSEQGLVFPNARGGPLRENHVLAEWHRALEAIGLEGEGMRPVRMHDLRHSKGTLMANAGEDVVVIQRTLGHAQVGMTADRYIGNVPKALRKAADRWDALLDGATETALEAPR